MEGVMMTIADMNIVTMTITGSDCGEGDGDDK